MLLNAMTEHLGQLEEWPTYILQHLFLDRPSPTRTSRLLKVIFFYGNDIPLKMANTFSQRVLWMYRSHGPFRGGTDQRVVLRMAFSKV